MVASVGSQRAGRRCLPGFAAAEHLDGRTSVVTVTGEIDLATVPSLEQQLLGAAEGGTGELIVDLTGCTFLDSRGLGALTRASARFARSDRPFALALSNPNVLKLLRIAGFDERVEIYPSLTAAVAGHGRS